jgi:hypothetical protein
MKRATLRLTRGSVFDVPIDDTEESFLVLVQGLSLKLG